MQAKTDELPLRGNYFAEADYLEQNLAAGTLQNRAAARMAALPDDLMVALCNGVAKDQGETGPETLKAIGREWGRLAGEQFSRELGAHHSAALTDQPLALFAADLSAAFLHHGWGRVQFDFSRYAQGLLLIDVTDSFLGDVVKATNYPVDGILAGFLGGMFSHFAGVELDGLQTECRAAGAARSRFVLTVPQRLRRVAGWVEAGRRHGEIVAELATSPA